MGTHHIVEAYTPALKKDLPREPIDKGKPELEHKQRDGRPWEMGGGGQSANRGMKFNQTAEKDTISKCDLGPGEAFN